MDEFEVKKMMRSYRRQIKKKQFSQGLGLCVIPDRCLSECFAQVYLSVLSMERPCHWCTTVVLHSSDALLMQIAKNRSLGWKKKKRKKKWKEKKKNLKRKLKTEIKKYKKTPRPRFSCDTDIKRYKRYPWHLVVQTPYSSIWHSGFNFRSQPLLYSVIQQWT